ncbi:hypothetical protein Vadar_025015 [Vaccinium darrowii]|uniref:Uncharacterized protein n=1 Tax=Vaccinium darrowii TaxID=229202 RepID=A0ACB7ZMF8_9ERIC|nr:hypothetical protein Vadar_025015 [Vaccinium darrowii]
MRIELFISWFFSITTLTILCSITIPVHSQCLEDQKSLLLQLKNSLQFDPDSSVNLTPIPSSFGVLTSLTYLNLSYTGFVGQIPTEFSRLTRLVTLDISTNYYFLGIRTIKIESPNLFSLFRNLSGITELRLDGVNISANGYEWGQAISSALPNLRVLSLRGCFLSGPIDSSLQNLHFLSEINLDSNNLAAPLPNFFANFSYLKVLSFISCNLYGIFPGIIFEQVQTLETLNLANNALLNGTLPDFPQNLSLRNLVLSFTNFSGNLPQSIGNLMELRRTEIPGCNFSGPIPKSLANLSHLVYLDFSSNNFSGQIPSFQESKNLTYIDLSHNTLTGALSTHFEGLSNLVYIDLASNSFIESIPSSLFSLPSLQKILLSNNKFGGQISVFSNESLSPLDTLDLSSNKLEGPIPSHFFDFRRLNILSLSFNNFSGTVALESIQRLKNLTRLELSYNNLTVDVSVNISILSSFPQLTVLSLASCNLRKFPALMNPSRVIHLDLSDNKISGVIPNWIWNVGDGKLTFLNLSCNLLVGLQSVYIMPSLGILDLHSNQLSGQIPVPPEATIYVDYSGNKFNSSIPAEVGNVIASAIFFSLSDNMLSGPIPPSICNGSNLQIPMEFSRLTRLVKLDLSNHSDEFSGKRKLQIEKSNLFTLFCNLSGIKELYLDGINISANGYEWGHAISFALPNLRVLSLRDCLLSGPIDSSLQNLLFLSELYLHSNNLSAPVPDFLANFANLTVLTLSSCNLYGTFPKVIFEKVQTLETLHLFANLLLNGSFPNFPQNMSLRELALSNTRFSGNLPESIGNLMELRTIAISGCLFSEQIPNSLANLSQLVIVDLSDNNFSGPIPSFPGWKKLTDISLSGNALTGVVLSTHFEGLLDLSYIDLSYNSLNGSIPLSLFSLPSLQEISLSKNKFSGQMTGFSNESLSPLDTLDLSSNKLQGPIPSYFFDFQSLASLSLSFNNFSGTIQLESFQRLQNIFSLDLSYNSLIVNASVTNSSLSSFPQLNELGLASCKLQKFPPLMNQSSLYDLDLSNNQISGLIPYWIWNISGGFPYTLNLSCNLLVGFQPEFSLPRFDILDLHSNQLQGEIPMPPEIAMYVDYSRNNFSSSIPAEIGKSIASAFFFSLSDNMLSGPIPPSICNGSGLALQGEMPIPPESTDYVDYSRNNFSSSFPAEIGKSIASASFFSLLDNMLSGPIPP